ncbi:MAG: nicotinate-nucleotide adenylyltransferase [Eubacteriales bacterium]|nr:nicotinate-nucleotide adenylyltransferase [Eubacteriales bacterium]
MRGYTEFSQLETEYLQPKQNRIGLLGGTFNPIHNGHIKMAYIALYEFLLGEVVFLPLGTPPHKKDEYIAPSQLRLDMIKMAIAREKKFSVDTIEFERYGTTYTVDTLEIMSRNNKPAEYYFIIGADTLFELKTWRNFERVICLTNFICILRPGQDDAAVRQYADMMNSRYGYKIYVAKDRGPDISSSLIRKLAVSKRPVGGLVPECVARYIQMNRVYAKED